MIVRGFFKSGSESLHVFYCLFIYVLPLKIQLSRWVSWDPIKTFDDFVFQKEGNKIQQKFNTDRATRLSDMLALIQSNRCEDAEVAIRSELEEIQQRNKLIKIADRHGWDTVREYTFHPLADNNEDAAKICKSFKETMGC